MEYILMRIRARYAALILSGRKTLEIRKTAPKGLREGAEITVLLYESKREGGRGVIVGSFVCRNILPVTMNDVREVCRRACLNREELMAYAERPQRIPGAESSTAAPGGRIYAWSVETPMTFEEPMLLRDVGVGCPPQSWRKLRKEQMKPMQNYLDALEVRAKMRESSCKEETMGSKEFIELCKEKVAQYFNAKKEKTDTMPPMRPEDVFVVWYCKTLQNHKAMLSTPVSDGMYYELTYNGDKNELYFDAYKKWENICYKV